MTTQELAKIKAVLNAPTIRDLNSEDRTNIKRYIDRFTTYVCELRAAFTKLELDATDLATVKKINDVLMGQS